MKVHRLLSLNIPVNELLAKEKNASALVETLLEQYYEAELANFDKKMDELKQKQSENKRKMKEIKRKMQEKEQKERKRLEFLEKEASRPYVKLSDEIIFELRNLRSKYV